MRVKLGEVPLEVRRRAARHLESVRGTPMAVGGEAAQLGPEACPVYRPDIRGVAYWELELTGVKAATRDGGEERREATSGFIVLSAGRHDVPIPHWSTELEPPSRTLEAQGKDEVARVVKLDSLAYAAESAKGAYVTHIGQFPPMPVSVPELPAEPVLSSLESHPVTPSKADRRIEKQTAKQTGVRAPKPKLAPWPSWAQAKKRYAAAYKPQLAALRAHAAPAWELEDLVAKMGEGIHEGERIVVPLLAPGTAELTGEGAAAVKMRSLRTKPPAVELVAVGAEKKAEQDFQLRLAYRDGTVETLTYFVVPEGTPSNRRRILPHPVPVLPPR